MYCYQTLAADHFAVGFFDPTGKWHDDISCSTRQAAAKRVAWLNGAGAPSIPELMTTDEAAEAMRLKPQTLRKWVTCQNGPLVPFKVAGRLMWRVSDILKLLGE